MGKPVFTGQVLGASQLGPGLLVLTQPDEGEAIHHERRGQGRQPRHPVGHREQRRQDRAGALRFAAPEPGSGQGQAGLVAEQPRPVGRDAGLLEQPVDIGQDGR
jgi:hypothetical protein